MLLLLLRYRDAIRKRGRIRRPIALPRCFAYIDARTRLFYLSAARHGKHIICRVDDVSSRFDAVGRRRSGGDRDAVDFV